MSKLLEKQYEAVLRKNEQLRDENERLKDLLQECCDA